MSDMLHLNKVRYISLFNMTLNSSGRLWIDDFAFTNIGDKLTGQSVSHATPVKSEPIGELVTKYPANKAIQIPKTFEVEAGIEEHISIHIMNKTEHELNGELKVEGLPVDNVDNALYKVYPKWVSYPHWPWRNCLLYTSWSCPMSERMFLIQMQHRNLQRNRIIQQEP